MAGKPTLELDLHEKIFDNDSERKELYAQMAQLSPRRAVNDGKFEVMTLPFCEEISPSTALDKLFTLFSKRVEQAAESNDSNTKKGDDVQEVDENGNPMERQEGEEKKSGADEQEEEGGADGDADANEEEQEQEQDEPQAADSISRDQFNVLRKCLGKPQVTDREWKRALEELATPEGEDRVKKKDFKALFGPAPFFGSPNVQGIVKYVMGAEEHIHFAKILMERFGETNPDDAMGGKCIGLQELQNIQTACCVDQVYGQIEWQELLKKLGRPPTQQSLDWMEFAEVFTVSIKGKKVFGAESEPSSVVYAVLANEKLLSAIKDPNETIVSRKAFTNLLKLKQTKVDDEKWMQLLEKMQTTYQYRSKEKDRRPRKDSAVTGAAMSGPHADGDAEEDSDHGTETPLVVVRNTRNQVLLYEITFDEEGDIGLQLQSDFYGHCLTVATTKGQAAKHMIIQEHDIVAMVNDTSLTFDRMAPNKAEEQDRIALGMNALRGQRIRKVTFQRQESYFKYDDETQILHLFMKTVDEIPPLGKFCIQLPTGLSWAPVNYVPGQETECLSVKFDQPVHEDLEYTTVQWNPASESIEISLEGYVAIEASSFVAMQIGGLRCGDVKLVGPCDVADGMTPAPAPAEGEQQQPPAPTHFVALYTDWKNRETAMPRNPVRDRVRRVGDFFDKSLEPIKHNFNPGESGLTLAGDFFGQCAVVEKVTEFSQAAAFGIQQHDILTSIAVVGVNDSLDFLNCIKPFALTKRNADVYLSDNKKRLVDCHKSGRMYRLQFLRLNSHFFHDNGRTIFTMHALTTLSRGTALVVKMPSAKWHAKGVVTATLVEPAGIKIKEVVWDSQRRTVHMILDECSVAESTQVVIEIQGIFSGAPGDDKYCGPGEVVGFHTGDASTVPEMEFELHEHWHSFVVGHQSLEASKVVETLKQFDTSPSKLWEVLEYTSLLFDMYKANDSADHISLLDLNRLIGIVCGSNKTMTSAGWNALCRNMGAKPFVGLTRRQFACCWYDVMGLSSHNAKDTYVRLHTAERLFKELVAIFQDSDDGDDEEDEDGNRKKPRRDLMSEETIDKLAHFVGISASKKKKALKGLKDKALDGWDCDTFSQIVCGKHPIVTIEDKDAMALWMKLYYAKKLFATYSAKKVMRKKHINELLAAAHITKPKLTPELWGQICDAIGIDDNGGLRLADFLDIYAGDLLGSRHAVADWYRIETFKLLPERHVKEEATKEAVLNVAPEKVNVKDIAAKVLEETANTEELFQDLLEKGLEFSKLEKIEERVATDFKFDTNLTAKKHSRHVGFLNIQIKSITELADRILQKDEAFNRGGYTEELYVLFQVTTAQGLKFRLPDHPPKSKLQRLRGKLFGENELNNCYVVKDDEKWDDGMSQKWMCEHDQAEKAMETHAHKPRSKEYLAALATRNKLEQKRLAPPPPPLRTQVAPEWRVFSSLITRDPSPDAIIRFPNDQFKLYVPPHSSDDQLYIVCKVFKRVGTEMSRARMHHEAASAAFKTAFGTFQVLQDLVEQQELHLRHVIADDHAQGNDAAKLDARSQVWTQVAKLKQKRQDLAEFQKELLTLGTKMKEAQQALALAMSREEAAFEKRQNQDAGNQEEEEEPADEDDNQNENQTVEGEGDVKFIGQAFFDLSELLNVLHDDKEQTQDLAVLRTETHNDVGVLLLNFQYKCASLQEQSVATPLPPMQISMGADDDTEDAIDSDAFEYPSHTHLEIDWKSDLLKLGDRICLIREGNKFKTSLPYFLLLWNSVDANGQAKPLKNKDDDEDEDEDDKDAAAAKAKSEDDGPCDWWVPEKLTKVYSHPGDKIVSTDASKRFGTVHFPSSIDLSLPPGIYKFYLIRNETDKVTKAKFRTVMGTSASLAVLPGVNGVHTSFGSTPLVDVKPISASLQVFSEANRQSTMVSSLGTTSSDQDGYTDHAYLKRIAVEQELEVVRCDLKAMESEYDRVKGKREGKTLAVKMSQFKMIMNDLESQKYAIMVPPVEMEPALVAAPRTDQVTLTIASNSNPAPPASARSHTVISSTDKAVFSFHFYGGTPTPEDRILILPADVVRISDVLRSTILGKLQANDPQQVMAARATMEIELTEVEAFFNFRLSWKSIKKIVWRQIKPLWDNASGGAGGATNKSDAYKAATGAIENSFVWKECMDAFSNASTPVKKYFPYIIRDLLEEIGARKKLLGLDKSTSKSSANKPPTKPNLPPMATIVSFDAEGKPIVLGDIEAQVAMVPLATAVAVDMEDHQPADLNPQDKKKTSGPAKNRLATATQAMSVGAEIRIPPLATMVSYNDEDKPVAVGEVSIKLGNRFRAGGFYVAKYVRRPKWSDGEADRALDNETTGELCRYGPFFVEPALFSFSPRQVAFVASKWIAKVVMSDQGKLAIKGLGQMCLSFLKYFLSVVSLSFNINVLAGNFKIDVTHLNELMTTYKAKLSAFYGPIEVVLDVIYTFFADIIDNLMSQFDFYVMAGECMTGFVLYGLLVTLFFATFLVYVVVQEDLLLKVQKIHTILPFNPGKSMLGFLEQMGGLLVIPMYLGIKSCVLFISGNWGEFYHTMNDDPSKTLEKLKLFTVATATCPNVSFAKLNHGFGIGALVLIIFFLFVCLPLLLLDLFSWVPLSELEDPEKLQRLAHSYNRLDIKAAVHSNANLIQFQPIRDLKSGTASCLSKITHSCRWCRRSQKTPAVPGEAPSLLTRFFRCSCRRGSSDTVKVRNPLFAGFSRHYEDYTHMKFRELAKKYGILGLFLMFVNIYAHLMLQSIGRALAVFLGWRLREESMYTNVLMKPKSKATWKIMDIFCLRFNLAWKVQYIKDKMVMPFVNVCLVTMGVWGESQWKEFNVEERANDCYRMEPSAEIKQLQMMALQGKIISLFWLCIPETMVLAYLAEVLNRGPVFSYFLNNQFLQADIPESEREKDPVWRFSAKMAFKGEEDVLYLSETRFASTLLKWSSAIVEIISLLMVYPPAAKNREMLFGITLISAVVTPLLEFNQQMIKAYMDYVETAENIGKSTGFLDKLEKIKKLADSAEEMNMPAVQLNLRAARWRSAKKATPPQTAAAAPAKAAVVAPTTGEVVAGAGAPTMGDTAALGATAAAGATAAPIAAKTPVSSRGSKLLAHMAGPNGEPIEIGSNGYDLDGLGGDDQDEDEEPEEDHEDDAQEEDQDEDGEDDEKSLAALAAAGGLVKPGKQLILLKAMPEVSYVVLTDALDVGEGELTINWQVNARQRFHALDAIGMFPARAAGDTTLRTMEDCICYRLLKQKTAETFGWNPKNEGDDAERELIIRQAKSLRDVSEREVTKFAQKSIQIQVEDPQDEREQEELVQLRLGRHRQHLERANSTMQTMLTSPDLRPYKKKMPDMLEEEVIEHKIHLTSPRTSRAFSKAAAAKEEAAKKARKIINGQVKFRPANNCVKEDNPQFETFIYGNDAGIYQSKYGLHGYEFCYLRCNDNDAKVVGVGGGGSGGGKTDGTAKVKEGTAASNDKTPKATATELAAERYEILERFVSNSIQIGTFNIFMNLTCDRPLVGAKEKLNLSWIIYGVAYSILSNPKMRNCIGFYRINGTGEATCARIEIVPASAYLEADDNEPCSGRMTVNTPNEPGIYEIRFLFNFFKKAQLHRQCQVFGELEDEMQQLRIRSFYEKRAIAEELRKFSLREPKVWGIARMNTHAWLKSMLLSTIREPVKNSVMESTTDYSEFLFGRLKTKLTQGIESRSRMYQRRITQMLAPLRLNAFMDVLLVALQSNSQMNDQLASVTYMSPTDEDEKKRGFNKERDMLLLPSDRDLVLFGNISFRPLAMNYLNQRSLCGYHDFVDDIVLNHGQLMQTLDQVMSNLSSSCVILYEPAIRSAIADMRAEAESINLTTALQGVDVMLMDLCRNHIQSLIRAVLETDCRTGMRWPGQPKGSFDKITALRSGTSVVPSYEAENQLQVVVEETDLAGRAGRAAAAAAAARRSRYDAAAAYSPVQLAAPLTREYIALRRWIRPKLERQIVAIMKQRYSRMLSGNWPIVYQFLISCRRPGLSLAGNPFPNHRRLKTDSPVYFLEESRQVHADGTIGTKIKKKKTDAAEQNQEEEEDEEARKKAEEEEEKRKAEAEEEAEEAEANEQNQEGYFNQENGGDDKKDEDEVQENDDENDQEQDAVEVGDPGESAE